MAPDWVSGDPAELRAWRERQPEVLRPAMPPGLEEIAIAPQESFCGGILFRPERSNGDTVILHFHGGGFVVGSPRTHRIVAATICAELGLPVLSAGYRLAPEHSLPAQANDAAAAIAHAHACLGSPLILAGDSAGALVALWGYNAAPRRNRDAVKGALLLYGVFGDPPEADDGNPALIEAGLDARSLAAYYHRVDPEHQIGSVRAFTPSMPGFHLPGRITVVGAGADPLLPHSVRFAARHPAICNLQVAKDLPHGFLSAPAPTAAARAAVRQAAHALGLRA